jgi:hypothetical protein
MLALLLLQAAAAQTAVDAERAFNQAAQEKGQWTAFREFAADTATMFVPQPVKAQEWLKDRKDPPRSVEWWPTEIYESCDGKAAVSTGGWKRPDGSVGYFTTVWQKQADGRWKWLADAGDTLDKARPRPSEPRRTRASCKPMLMSSTPAFPEPGVKTGGALSSDRSLSWGWRVTSAGARTFSASTWDGSDFIRVISDEAAAPE